MSKRVAVIYATRCSSTAEVAEAVARALGARELRVELLTARSAPALDVYDGVVIGSAVRYGRWLPEAAQLVEA